MRRGLSANQTASLIVVLFLSSLLRTHARTHFNGPSWPPGLNSSPHFKHMSFSYLHQAYQLRGVINSPFSTANSQSGVLVRSCPHLSHFFTLTKCSPSCIVQNCFFSSFPCGNARSWIVRVSLSCIASCVGFGNCHIRITLVWLCSQERCHPVKTPIHSFNFLAFPSGVSNLKLLKLFWQFN